MFGGGNGHAPNQLPAFSDPHAVYNSEKRGVIEAYNMINELRSELNDLQVRLSNNTFCGENQALEAELQETRELLQQWIQTFKHGFETMSYAATKDNTLAADFTHLGIPEGFHDTLAEAKQPHPADVGNHGPNASFFVQIAADQAVMSQNASVNAAFWNATYQSATRIVGLGEVAGGLLTMYTATVVAPFSPAAAAYLWTRGGDLALSGLYRTYDGQAHRPTTNHIVDQVTGNPTLTDQLFFVADLAVTFKAMSQVPAGQTGRPCGTNSTQQDETFIDKMSPEEAARYREYWGGMHDTRGSAPFSVKSTFTKNGELKTVTTFDQHGRPHRQYGLREGEPVHEHGFTYPQTPQPGTGNAPIRGPQRPIGSNE